MSICAVIVSYHPGAGIVENVAAIIDQVDEVVIVDNGSGDQTREMLKKLSCSPKVRVVYNSKNLGIAVALNIGAKYAKEAGHQWLATFDQDSKATLEMIATMLHAYNVYPEKEKIASLSPRYRNPKTGKIRGNSPDLRSGQGKPFTEVQVVMTSGNLVKLSVFDKVGYFNEALFIDHVDNEFCLRCGIVGYKILEIKDAILEHCIGYPSQHKFLWKTTITSNHGALRRYYIARNSVYIYRKFVFTRPMWVLKDAFGLFKVVILLMLFETDRKKKLGMVCLGILHGVCGRLGQLTLTVQ